MAAAGDCGGTVTMVAAMDLGVAKPKCPTTGTSSVPGLVGALGSGGDVDCHPYRGVMAALQGYYLRAATVGRSRELAGHARLPHQRFPRLQGPQGPAAHVHPHQRTMFPTARAI